MLPLIQKSCNILMRRCPFASVERSEFMSKHLKLEDRKNMESLLKEGVSFKEIGRTLTGSPRILHIATHGYFFPDADRTISAKDRMTNDPAYSGGTASE